MYQTPQLSSLQIFLPGENCWEVLTSYHTYIHWLHTYDPLWSLTGVIPSLDTLLLLPHSPLGFSSILHVEDTSGPFWPRISYLCFFLYPLWISRTNSITLPDICFFLFPDQIFNNIWVWTLVSLLLNTFHLSDIVFPWVATPSLSRPGPVLYHENLLRALSWWPA